jgi:ERCC4-type nuclease
VHKVLTGGSISGYIPRPKDFERQSFALSMARNIGPKISNALMIEYGSIANLSRASLEELASFQIDGRKIGQSKAESLMRLLHGEMPGKHDIHVGRQ